ncbi:MAG: hypothetical protein H7282_16840 [Cytophagaceae bacterium]|nr:hypothetical protein [Cytophagaceae bacterium]
MKISHHTSTLLALLTLLTLNSCSSTNYLTLSVDEPAPVYVPSYIKKAGVVDRSLPSENNKIQDNIDKILSAEGKNLDKEGADYAAKALTDALSNNYRFSEIRLISDVNLRSPGQGIYPAPIPWDQVTAICNANQVDALFVLCFYDTDTRVDYAAIPVEITTPLGFKVPAIEQQATCNTLIKTGWRIYDPSNRIILDEYQITDNIVTTGRGINPMKAYEAIAGRKEAVLQASRQIGQNYADRILPYRIRVRRTYYVRGSNNFTIAKRRAQTGNWDGAAELWKKEVNSSKQKIAGRATYNIAIISEINGDLDAAIDWASKSYTDYNNKLALSYLNILKNRKRKNEQLKNQQQ